ncbi:MAG TPA: alpha/beta hydrolase [Anaerolineales bacterium]|nr:alpha/beta hydrolase [Anaerolineales bacterium]
MKPALRWTLAAIGFSLLACLCGTLVIPIPPPAETVPPAQLAGPNGSYLEIEGLELYTESAGSGEPLILLLHGFGASAFSWRDVLEPLGRIGTSVAYDRTGFGLSTRPLPGEWEGESPYSAASQAELVPSMIEALGAEDAVLIGNSAGGTVAVLAALEHPERVRALVLVSPAVYTTGGLPSWIKPLLALPPFDRIGPLLVRRIATEGMQILDAAWHDPGRITPERIGGYRLPLQAENWDQALWQVSLAPSPPPIGDRLEELSLPVLIITGDDDRVVPTADSIQLAGEIPQANLVVLPECGHLPQEECPVAFLEAVTSFLVNLP